MKRRAVPLLLCEAARCAARVGFTGVVALVCLAGCEGGDGLVEGIDLKMVELRIPSVTGLKDGDNISVTVLVKNNGTRPVSRSFMTEVKFFEDAALTEEGDWSAIPTPYAAGLASGETVALVLSTIVDAAAPPQLVFCKATCDSEDTVSEADESNNVYVKTCQVLSGTGGGPTPPPTNVDLEIAALSILTGVIESGGDLGLVVTVVNLGYEISTLPFTLSVTAYEDESLTQPLWEAHEEPVEQDVAPGQGVTIPVTLYSEPSGPTGVFYLVAVVDSLNQISETDEGNNETTDAFTFTIVPAESADLGLTALSVPAEIDQGQTAPVQVRIGNVGVAVVQDPFAVTLTAYFGAQVYFTDTKTVDAALNPGGEVTVNFEFLPAGILPLGEIYFDATVGSGDIQEITYRNNLKTETSVVIEPPPRPDLVVSALAPPAQVERGSVFTVSVTVANGGVATATAPFSAKVSVYTDASRTSLLWGEQIATQQSGLAPGAEATLSVSFSSQSTDPLGTIYITAQADVDGQVAELDEGNNWSTAESLIVLPPQPDLVIGALTVPATVERGNDLAVGITVRNAGDGTAAGHFTVNVTAYRDASHENTLWTPWEQVHTDDLASGADATFLLSFTSRYIDPQQTMYLVATVDALDDVTEFDEGNNEQLEQFDIVAPSDPDLIVSSISAPDQIEQGQTVSVSVAIKNVGGSPAYAPFDVGFSVYSDEARTIQVGSTLPWTVTSSMNVGAETQHSFSFEAAEDQMVGSIYFVAEADTGGVVVEERDDNNDAMATSEMISPILPDLVAVIVDCDDTYQNGGASGSLALTFKVSNIGQAAADGTLAFVWLVNPDDALDTVPNGPYAIPSLAPGAETVSYAKSYTFTVTLPAPPGDWHYYRIEVRVNQAPQTFEEEDYANNTATHLVLIYE